jgi:hypothetical protein
MGGTPSASSGASTKSRYLVFAVAGLVLALSTILQSPAGGSTQGGLVVSVYHLQAVGDLVIALTMLLVLSVLLLPLGVSTNVRYMLAALALFLLWIVLLSALGFENRSVPVGPALSTWIAWRIGVGSPGIWLSFASLILLFFRRRTAAILGIVGPVLLLVYWLSDQLGLQAWSAPPAVVSIFEVIASATVLVILYFASKVYREKMMKIPAISNPQQAESVSSKSGS